MKQQVKWWHWLIAGSLVVCFCLFLGSRILNPPIVAPPAPRGVNLSDEQVKQKAQAEVDQLVQLVQLVQESRAHSSPSSVAE